jgi:hypothetical protein
MSTIIRQHLTADANHTIHLVLPPEMGDEVDIIVIPRSIPKADIPEGNTEMLQLTEDEQFMLAAYSAVVESDPEENAVWEQYVRT